MLVAHFGKGEHNYMWAQITTLTKLNCKTLNKQAKYLRFNSANMRRGLTKIIEGAVNLFL